MATGSLGHGYLENGTETDVLVVGGGPAGLLTAETVAGAGHEALLVEREAEIGSPVHTSGGTAVATMQRFNIPHELYHVIHRWRFRGPTQEAVFEDPYGVGCGIDVRGVYQHLAERARQKGATILTGVRGDEPLRSGDAVVGCALRRGAGERWVAHSKVLVDATGYVSAISRKAGMHPGFQRFGVGAEYDMAAPRCRQDEVVLVLGSRFAPSGYAWVLPWGRNRVRVGVGVLHADTRADPRPYLETFVKEAGAFGVDLRDHRVAEYHYGLIPSDGMARQWVGDGILAVGDAAGQASLVAGEGIRLSMIAGQMAGDTVAKALAAGRVDREALTPYVQAFRKSYGRDLRIGHVINKRMSTWDDATWDRRVGFLRSVPPQLVLRLLQSEFPLRELAGWVAGHPRLWLRGLGWAQRYGWRLAAGA